MTVPAGSILRSLVPAILAVALVAVPAPASVPDVPSGDAPRTEALVPVRQMRAGLASGSLEDAVLAAAALRDVSVRADPSISAALFDGVPARIAGPVGSLLEEIASATEVARGALREDPSEVERLLDEARELTRASAARLPGRDGDFLDRSATARHRARLEQIRARLEAALDQPSLYAATAALARAVDEALPVLRARAAPARTGAAEPCDIAERFPELCVSSEAAHEYTKDYALLIDLGGDDTYVNHAGAGDATIGSSYALDLLPVSMVLDLSGDDVYGEPKDRSISDYYGVQGSGSRGGIGMLVDVEGDDRYEATIHGQGMAFLGVGVLSDGAGTDRYEVVNRAPGAYLEESTGRYFTNVGAARGQAHASAGMSLLLDRGFGDDTYVLDGQPVPFEVDGHVYPGGVYVEGQGVAFAGVAVFSDGGGSDAMTVRGASDPELVSDRDRRTVQPGFANASGMAYAVLGGQAVHLTGEGHTARTLDADVRFGYLAWTTGMASANLGSYAALEDEAGNDTYAATAARRTIRKLTIDEENATQDHVVVATTAGGEIQTWTFAQGDAELQSVALLHDGEGDDTYSVTTLAHAEAEARNELPTLPADPDTPSAVASASAGVAAISGQGYAQEDSAGYLLDDGGNDAYAARTISRALARASSSHPDALNVAEAFSGETQNIAQGSSVYQGYAELRDRGGRDAYVLESVSEATADPPTAEVVPPPENLWSWGWAFTFDIGDARFVDLGGTDTFTITPTLPACIGTRGGDGVWVDCNPFGVGAGVGMNL